MLESDRRTLFLKNVTENYDGYDIAYFIYAAFVL